MPPIPPTPFLPTFRGGPVAKRANGCVLPGKYGTLKHAGRFFSDGAHARQTEREEAKRQKSWQRGRRAGTPPCCALMPLNHPQLTQAAVPSWHRGCCCFCWHGDSPLLEEGAFSPRWPEQARGGPRAGALPRLLFQKSIWKIHRPQRQNFSWIHG